MTEDTYETPSVGHIDASGLAGPPTRDGYLYLALRLQRLGVKDRLQSTHTSPTDAYRAVVEHAGKSPGDDYTPEWPEGDWGDDVWGWNTDDGSTYIIQQYRWSGIDAPEAPPILTKDEVSEGSYR